VAVDGVAVAVRVAVAGWQWDHWIRHTLAVILSGDKLQFGAILTEFGLYLYFYKKKWQWLGWQFCDIGFFLTFFLCGHFECQNVGNYPFYTHFPAFSSKKTPKIHKNHSKNT
jgi:hypothetical protein